MSHMNSRKHGKYLIIIVLCSVALVLWMKKSEFSYFAPLEADYNAAAVSLQTNGFIPLDSKRQQRQQEYENLVNEVKNSDVHKRLPDVIGVGVEKCGTTAWLDFINHHPLIATNRPRNRERNYFNKKVLQPLKSYISALPKASSQQLIVEKTPGYFKKLVVPQRIKETVPEVKLILIVCDPVYRYFSDIVHEKIIGRIHMNESLFLAKESNQILLEYGRANLITEDFLYKSMGAFSKNHILLSGIYDIPLKRWFQYFQKEQIFIIDGEEFITNPGRQIELLQDFLNIPKLLLEEDFVQNPETKFFCAQPPWIKDFECLRQAKGRTRNNEKITHAPDDIKTLAEFFKPFNENFFQMIGTRYNWTN